MTRRDVVMLCIFTTLRFVKTPSPIASGGYSTSCLAANDANQHGFYQSELVIFLKEFLPWGKTITKCAMQTAKGVKVADVVWCSTDFLKNNPLRETPFLHAPELCIEIVSPSNSSKEMLEKIDLYLQQGAQEVWLVYLTGKVELFSKAGKATTSVLNHAITEQVLLQVISSH